MRYVLLFSLVLAYAFSPVTSKAGTFMVGAKYWYANWDSAILDWFEKDIGGGFKALGVELRSDIDTGSGYLAGPLLGYQTDDGSLAVSLAPMLFSSFSQDWTGQGRQIGFVYDEEGNPLEGVKVKLFFVKTQSGFETTTDKKGKWSAMGVKNGMWYIDFELTGYEPKKISTNILGYKKQNKPIEMRLKKVEGLYVTEEMKEEYKKGVDLFNEGKYEESIAAYNVILEKFPDAYIVHMNIGHSYFQLENYEEAEKSYLKVLENDPEHVDSLIGVGNCHMNRGETEKAIEWYNKIEFDKIENPR